MAVKTKKKNVTKVRRVGNMLYITHKGKKFAIKSRVDEDDEKGQLAEVVRELRKIRRELTREKDRITTPKTKLQTTKLQTTNSKPPVVSGSSGAQVAELKRQSNIKEEQQKQEKEKEQRLLKEKEEQQKQEKEKELRLLKEREAERKERREIELRLLKLKEEERKERKEAEQRLLKDREEERKEKKETEMRLLKDKEEERREKAEDRRLYREQIELEGQRRAGLIQSIDDLEGKERKLIKDKESTEKDLETITIKRTEAEKILNKLKQEYKDENNRLTELNKQLSNDYKKSKSQVDRLNQQIYDAGRELEEKQTQIKDLSKKVEKLQENENNLIDKQALLDIEITALSKEKQELDVSNNQLKEENKNLATTLETLKKEYEDLTVTCNELYKTSDEILILAEQKQKEIQELQQQKTALQADLSELGQENLDLGQENLDLVSRVDKLSEEIDMLEAQRNEYFQTLSELENKIEKQSDLLLNVEKRYGMIKKQFIIYKVRTLQNKQLEDLIDKLGVTNFGKTKETFLRAIIPVIEENDDNFDIAVEFLKNYDQDVRNASKDNLKLPIQKDLQKAREEREKIDNEIEDLLKPEPEAEPKAKPKAKPKANADLDDDTINLDDIDFNQIDIDALLNDPNPGVNPDLNSGSGRFTSPGGLYNVEIDEFMKDLRPKGFKGTYSVDELDEIPLSANTHSFSFVMNTEPSNVANGHWVSVFVTPSAIEYFDPFGDDPKPDFHRNIMRLIKKWKPENVYQLKVNNVKRQRNNSTNCGYFAMKFLNDRYNGKTFKDATGFKIMEDSLRGEKEIKAFKDKLKDFGYIRLKQGEGFIADATKWLTGRYPGEKALKKLISQHGQKTITSITVMRTPIKAGLLNVLNIFTKGKFEEARKNLNYDKLFHLFMFITLSDGYKFRLEKNQTITISNDVYKTADTEEIPVPGVAEKNLQLDTAIYKTREKMGEKNFFVYSAFQKNCQDFIYSFLTANGLVTEELKEFVLQDVEGIVKALPAYSAPVADVLTDIAGFFDGVQGNGR